MEDNRRISKRIIGVPVFPGSSPGMPVISVQPSAPAPHSILNDDTPTHATASPVLNSKTRKQSNIEPQDSPDIKAWKLGHVDFFPATLDKAKKDEDVESFGRLVERANEWLRSNAFANLFTVETVQWMAVDRPQYTDAGLLTKSMHADKKTKIYKGLRLWYHTTDDKFYNEKDPASSGILIGFMDYVNPPKVDSMKALISKVNMALYDTPLYGQPLRLETLQLPVEMEDTMACCWKEEPQKDKNYMTFLRLLYVVVQSNKMTRCMDLGYKDFLPQFNQRTPHNQGYETYAEVWRRVARWVHENPGYKYLNIQSVYIKCSKSKKDVTEDEILDRCFYKEHGCAMSSLHSQRTDYFQVIRVAFAKRQVAATDSLDSYRLKMAYRNFYPCRLEKEVKETEEDVSDGSYEDLGQVEEKLNTWIQCSGARLMSIETAPVRLLSGGQEVLGPEATFVNNSRDRNIGKEMWRVNIRLYLEGTINETTANVLGNAISKGMLR